MVDTAKQAFDVGGVMLERPFKVKRLGHVGFSVDNMDECMHFYRQLLGFRISDFIDRASRVEPGELDGLGDPKSYFMRYAGDHHSFVLGSKAVMDVVRPGRREKNPRMDIGQISWQVDSAAEIVASFRWLGEQGVTINRSGRDMPGSNWHTYFDDPDGHNNEVFYGMEQIGWDGITKSKPMYRDRIAEVPALPRRSESEEIEDSIRDGINITDGNRDPEEGPFDYDVDGVMLARPFRIVSIGPIGLFANDLETSLAFYTDSMGFKLTESVDCLGDTVHFLRANAEHHSLALHPWSLKEKLGIPAESTCAVMGFQLANYKQLRAAVDFLRSHEVPVFDTPLEFHTGIDHAVHFLDPDGHCVLLYHAMEHVGWDGQPRPAAQRTQMPLRNWPDALPDTATSYAAENFLGPLG